MPVVAVCGLPSDRPLWIVGVRQVGGEIETEHGEPGGPWASIRVQLSDAPVASSTELGTVGVDWARLAFADADAIASWEHDSPIDGLADVAFWGRSEMEAATVHDAPLVTTAGEAGVYGWTDLPVGAAVERARALMSWTEAAPDRKLMVDFRPHSHHWQVMRAVRADPNNAGVVEVGGARILFAHTSWGDGFFPVLLDRDAHGQLVAIRVAFV